MASTAPAIVTDTLQDTATKPTAELAPVALTTATDTLQYAATEPVAMALTAPVTVTDALQHTATNPAAELAPTALTTATDALQCAATEPVAMAPTAPVTVTDTLQDTATNPAAELGICAAYDATKRSVPYIPTTQCEGTTVTEQPGDDRRPGDQFGKYIHAQYCRDDEVAEGSIKTQYLGTTQNVQCERHTEFRPQYCWEHNEAPTAPITVTDTLRCTATEPAAWLGTQYYGATQQDVPCKLEITPTEYYEKHDPQRLRTARRGARCKLGRKWDDIVGPVMRRWGQFLKKCFTAKA